MTAFQVAKAGVSAWESPAAGAGLPAAPVQVSLRLDGLLVGRGVGLPGEEGEPLGLALAEAMRTAEERMPLPNDATRGRVLASLRERLTLSVEIAREIVPLAPEALAEATLLLSPGVEGVAVRQGEEMLVMFPSMFIEQDRSPSLALRGLVGKLAGDPTLGLKTLEELQRDHGFAFYKFQSLHLAQLDVGGQPEFLHRSGRVVSQGAFTSAYLQNWAEMLASHLLVQDGGRVVGSLDPRTGEREPANVAQQALIAWALLEHAELAGEAEQARIRSAVTAMARRAAADVRSESAKNPDVAGLWLGVLAMLATDNEPALSELRSAVRTQAVAWAEREAGAAPPAGAPLAWGLAMAADRGDAGTRELARQLSRDLLGKIEPGQLVAHMPFLGDALVLTAEADPLTAGVAPLRQMRAMVWANQVTHAEAGAFNADLVGGITFTKGGSPLPSWHSARPLATAAAMLGDTRFTPEGEFASEFGHLLSGLRFLRQLTADEWVVHMYPGAERARGGVRAALWDQRMPAEATALTLLAVNRTRDALRALAAKRAGE